MTTTHRAPTACPVCSHDLITLRVGCPSCGTEISGQFEPCRFCRLDAADVELLEVFLRSRGNLRDVQAHLGVSYPTARQRFTDLLVRMGLGDSRDQVDSASVLRDLAAGRISVDDAEALLEGTTGGGADD
ncbi:MAG: DUF2089 domain-containing protein [Candidatus Nanopelagicales bacterium]|jgi:hypothetical protein